MLCRSVGYAALLYMSVLASSAYADIGAVGGLGQVGGASGGTQAAPAPASGADSRAIAAGRAPVSNLPAAAGDLPALPGALPGTPYTPASTDRAQPAGVPELDGLQAQPGLQQVPSLQQQGQEQRQQEMQLQQLQAQQPKRQRAAATQSATPVLLTIAYNQEPSYYQRFLKQVVTDTEKNGRDTVYQVVLLVPAKAMRTHSGVTSLVAFNNQAATVVEELRGMGIPSARIRRSTAYHNDINVPEINLYGSRPE